MHTHPLSSVPQKTDGETLRRERSADHLGSHYTTQAITVSLSLCLSVSLSSATGDDLICSHAFLSERAKQENLLSWLHMLLICS